MIVGYLEKVGGNKYKIAMLEKTMAVETIKRFNSYDMVFYFKPENRLGRITNT